MRPSGRFRALSCICSAATLYFLLISSVLNIVLDLLFIAGFHWGVMGAALATDIAQMTFIQRAVNGFGKEMTASFTVGQRVEMYLNMPCNAFQTTLATYAGQNIGAGKLDRVRLGVRQTMLIVFTMTGVLYAGGLWQDGIGISEFSEQFHWSDQGHDQR